MRYYEFVILLLQSSAICLTSEDCYVFVALSCGSMSK